jgi:hypothetical protein
MNAPCSYRKLFHPPNSSDSILLGSSWRAMQMSPNPSKKVFSSASFVHLQIQKMGTEIFSKEIGNFLTAWLPIREGSLYSHHYEKLNSRMPYRYSS